MTNRERYNLQWERIAYRRRLLLGVLIGVTAFVASGYMAMVLPYRGSTAIEVAIVFFFALLFAWISIGFWTSLLGFITLLGDQKQWHPTRHLDKNGSQPAVELQPTAILLPIYNEDVRDVFHRLVAIIRSLKQTRKAEHFHFFVLSDTTKPDLWVEEERAWASACRKTDSFGSLFYRHRTPNIKHKSGNIADFCRRWGRAYKYMVVLDADSIMSGQTLVRMVQIMEQDPSIGILQSVPIPAGRSSLHARLQQFSAQMYGPMFAAGLHYWQLGDAQYWGHNVIIRVDPFMKHCALPRLSGSPPLGGDILSHDFVEAALMRRAGWGVWLSCDLDGSYEEPPPTLIEELIRDRRWCQGNLQHLRLLFTRGLFPAHRYLFLNGAMSYISALLWLIFLSLSSIEALAMAFFEPDYFPRTGSLFPDWQVWNPEWMLVILVATVIILFLPKVLSLILALVIRRRAAEFGGWFKAVLSLIGEVFFSTLLAPLRMLAHSKFVFITLLGSNSGWNPATRSDQGTTWRQAFRYHGGGMLMAVLWGAIFFLMNRSFFWWLIPILAPLALAAPISVWTSKPRVGAAFRRIGIFLTATEVAPPPELQLAKQAVQSAQAEPAMGTFSHLRGFVRAVVDPKVFCLHRAIRPRYPRVSPKIAERLNQLVKKAVVDGPHNLTDEEKKQLLYHPASLIKLHQLVWELPDGQSARQWGVSRIG
ncbi:glucans biosynthesis glucosyltransferase MdoH [Desulfosarcina sp.]|uniref:glucans biosynthesis glucosyltransferase MdoH n=1 Tax=Desulfosarcina sp. TaxID=2027861 RepID=UPI00397064F1